MPTFIPRGTYRMPEPIEVPLGQPVVIPATTVHVAQDDQGHEIGYVVARDTGSKHTSAIR